MPRFTLARLGLVAVLVGATTLALAIAPASHGVVTPFCTGGYTCVIY